jgi:hypothetical protein
MKAPTLETDGVKHKTEPWFKSKKGKADKDTPQSAKMPHGMYRETRKGNVPYGSKKKYKFSKKLDVQSGHSIQGY